MLNIKNQGNCNDNEYSYKNVMILAVIITKCTLNIHVHVIKNLVIELAYVYVHV